MTSLFHPCIETYHNCLEAVVTLLIRQQVKSKPTMRAKVIDAAYELVAFCTICTQGIFRGVSRTLSTSGPIVNMIVYTITDVSTQFH